MATAEQFDRQVERFEKLRDGRDDFSEFRKKLLRDIRGDVLEIAPGPGFNFPYYNHITSLIAVDLSSKMTESAEREWNRISTIPGTFMVGDVFDVSFSESQFDSTVSTCSLCAYPDPVAVLNQLAKWCRPDGRVYLLEHGLSDYWLIRGVQYAYEPFHYNIHACHCNRDIDAIVRQSELEIISIERPRRYALIDFMYSIVAKPAR